MTKRNTEDLYIKSDDEEYLTRCVVDTSARRFYMYSNEGETQIVDCDTTEQFMDVLKVCREFLKEELVYAEPQSY
jgi:hypothetical protein